MTKSSKQKSQKRPQFLRVVTKRDNDRAAALGRAELPTNQITGVRLRFGSVTVELDANFNKSVLSSVVQALVQSEGAK